MNKIAQQLTIGSLLLLILMGVMLGWSWKNLPPQIPWFYSLPSGEQQLVNKEVLVWTLVGTMLLVIMTRGLSAWAGKKDIIVENTITLGSLVAVLLLMASFWRVMQIFVGL